MEKDAIIKKLEQEAKTDQEKIMEKDAIIKKLEQEAKAAQKIIDIKMINLKQEAAVKHVVVGELINLKI